MRHYEKHPQILIKNNIVVKVLTFDEHDLNLINQTAKQFDYDYLVDFCDITPEIPNIGDGFNGQVFIAKPFPSWILNQSLLWEAPKPKPDGDYIWNEATSQWILNIKD